MKAVGETSFLLMGKYRKPPKSMTKRNVKIVCGCGATYYESEQTLKIFPMNSKLCRFCRKIKIAKDRHETNLAIIAVAKRRTEKPT